SDVRPGDAFIPMHWNDQFAGSGCVNRVVNPETDAVSGQPELKHTPVRVSPWVPAWRALILTRRRPRPDAEWWYAAPRHEHWCAELAGTSPAAEAWRKIAGLLADEAGVEFEDAGHIDHRLVALDEAGRVASVAFLQASPKPLAIDAEWLGDQFG